MGNYPVAQVTTTGNSMTIEHVSYIYVDSDFTSSSDYFRFYVYDTRSKDLTLFKDEFQLAIL